MRLIRSAIMWYLETSTSICNASSRRAATASRVAVEPKLDIARYHMIGPSINLMNFSAVTIFLARVVLPPYVVDTVQAIMSACSFQVIQRSLIITGPSFCMHQYLQLLDKHTDMHGGSVEHTSSHKHTDTDTDRQTQTHTHTHTRMHARTHACTHTHAFTGKSSLFLSVRETLLTLIFRFDLKEDLKDRKSAREKEIGKQKVVDRMRINNPTDRTRIVSCKRKVVSVSTFQ